MTAPGGQIAKGATLHYGDVEATVDGCTNAVAQIVSMSGPSISVNEVECTLLADTTKAYLAGMTDYGEISLTLRYATADTINLQSLLATQKTWLISIPGGAATNTILFEGYLKSLGGQVPEDGVIDQAATIKINNDRTMALA